MAIPPRWLLRDATIVLLAGGEGRRLGGPKVDLVVDGEPILVRARQRFSAHRVALSLKPGQSPVGMDLFDLVLLDESPDPSAGELARSLVARVNGDGVLLPIDMPLMDTDTLAELGSRLDDAPDAAAAMFERSGEVEPLPLAFRAGLADILARRIATGDRSIRGLADEPCVERLRIADGDNAIAWTHLNDATDVVRSGLAVTRTDASPEP